MKKKFGTILAVLSVIAFLFLGLIAGSWLENKKHKEPEISTSAISTQLSKLSDLTTAKLQYRGLIRYSQGEIPILTKKEFTMIYDATLKAGIDLSKAEISIDEDTIKVLIPKAALLDIIIDPDTLEFYDEKYALFNFQDREDTVEALQNAKEDAKERIDTEDLLDTANQQAKMLIENLLAPMAQQGEKTYDITVEFLD